MSVLSLFIPDKCIFCDSISDKSRVCERCRDLLPETVGLRSERNGEFFTTCVSPFYYKGVIRESLLRYKFGRHQSYAAVYARYCTRLIQERLNDRFEIMTWVPVSRKRRRERGFDQSELIAKEIGRELNVPCCRLLVKNRDTPKQSTYTDIARRRANVNGAFKEVGHNAMGKRILLVDDIITTGATLSECARVLLMNGAEDVVCCTIAMLQS